MPIHDWTRLPGGLFHHFHQDWSIEIARELNRGRLPRGLSALVEQRSGPREADVLTIESTRQSGRLGSDCDRGVVRGSPVHTDRAPDHKGDLRRSGKSDCRSAPFGPYRVRH